MTIMKTETTYIFQQYVAWVHFVLEKKKLI